MKKTLFLFLLLFSIYSTAQNNEKPQQVAGTTITNKDAKFLLFPTHNMWTFIKLNTKTGQLWQVQYTVSDNSQRQEFVLNSEALADSSSQSNGRFYLYPTQNIYNFLLIDQIDGRVWQVQWSLDPSTRGIIPF